MKQIKQTPQPEAPEGMEGHTPGEWSIDPDYNDNILSAQDCTGWRGKTVVCTINEWLPERKVNARLIASAPSLLKENKRLQACLIASESERINQRQQQAKDIELLRDALQDLVSWSNIKDGSPSQYLRDAANKALKQTEPAK